MGILQIYKGFKLRGKYYYFRVNLPLSHIKLNLFLRHNSIHISLYKSSKTKRIRFTLFR
jgi:hypothetical protein